MRRIHRQTQLAARKLFLTAMLLLPCCLAACGSDTRQTGEATQSSSRTVSSSTTTTQQTSDSAAHAQQNTSNAQTASSSSTNAQDEGGVLLDLRKGLHREPLRLDSQTQRRIVQAAYGEQAKTDDYTINSSARGSFTGAGRKETVYLVQRGGPVAADPNGAQEISLLVFDDAAHAIAHLKTRDFNFVEATSDVDGDGVNELFLSGSFYNMGTLASSVRLVELKNKRLRVVREFEDVYENPCDGDRNASVTAGVIYSGPSGARGAEALRVTLFRAPCPATSKGEPDPHSFVPLESEKSRP